MFPRRDNDGDNSLGHSDRFLLCVYLAMVLLSNPGFHFTLVGGMAMFSLVRMVGFVGVSPVTTAGVLSS